MTYATKPGNCIDRVTSQNGERVDFERVETPRPAPKVTLKKHWQSQQQQHSSSCTDVPNLVKTKVEKEHWTGVQDGSKHSTEVTTSPGKLGQIASDMETDTVLKTEDITDTISQTEAVKDEANTEAITKLRWAQTRSVSAMTWRTRLRQSHAKRLLDIGNEEFHRVHTTYLREHMYDHVGKHIRSNQEMIDRTRKASDILKTPFFRASRPTARGYKRGAASLQSQ